ncbi:hypothetical protein D3C87_1317430 [compost metagenome]
MTVTVSPCGKLFVHPGRRARWRVGQQVADGLGPGHHHCAIGGVAPEKGAERVVSVTLRIGQSGGRWIATVDRLDQFRRHGGRHVQVNAK